MQKLVTIKDISRTLNISVSTVSRALRNTYDVSPETREKVLAKASEMRYQPNFNAISLAGGKTHNIGVVLPLITNYYFSTVVTGMQEAAYKNGYNVILFITDNSSEKEILLTQDISIASLDGLLVSVTSNKGVVNHYNRIIKNYKKPIVFFDRAIDRINTSKVLQDDYNGAVEAVEHLIKNGYGKIAHITGPKGLDLTQRRLKGYIDTLKKHDVPVNPKWIVHSEFSQQSGEQDARHLFQSGETPDAIFAVNDRKAVGAILALKEKNIVIGKEVGVIGFTNDPIASIVTPTLSTISEPAFDIGKQSVEILFKHLSKKEFLPRDIILPCKLIKRESTMRY